MIPSPIRRLVILTAAAALAAGCAKKVTSVSESYTSPEGTASAGSRLVLSPDHAVPRFYFADFSPPGPSPNDVVDSVGYLRRGTAATLHGMIFDGTGASGYQIFRQEQGGGMRLLTDFVVKPSQRWVDSQWELYSFRDDDPARPSPTTYRARGLLSGAATERSPLSNLAASTTDTALADIGLRIINGAPPFEPYIDSLFTVAWNPVPGAAAYILHVFQFRNDLRSEDERTLGGAPAPFFEGKSKDLYAAYFPSTVTQHKLGSGGGVILTRRQTYYGQVYLTRVSAVDANGRMIATTLDGDLRIGPYENGYTLQPLTALAVAPTRVPPLGPARAATMNGRPARILDGQGLRILQPAR